MKKFLVLIAALFITSAASQAQSLSSLLGALKNAGSSSSSTTTTTTSSQSTSSGLSSLLGSLGQTIQNVTASSSFSLDDIVGTWNYSSPAVAFKSSDVLKNVGGAAVATQIENKLSSYYKKMGLTNVVLTVDSSYNFTMKLKLATLKGTIAKNDDGTLTFNFSAFGTYTLGSVNSIATKSGNQLNITFDAERLISIMQTISKVANNSTINSVMSLISSYDGIYIGFKLKK
jgi:hypothetical protein